GPTDNRCGSGISRRGAMRGQVRCRDGRGGTSWLISTIVRNARAGPETRRPASSIRPRCTRPCRGVPRGRCRWHRRWRARVGKPSESPRSSRSPTSDRGRCRVRRGLRCARRVDPTRPGDGTAGRWRPRRPSGRERRDARPGSGAYLGGGNLEANDLHDPMILLVLLKDYQTSCPPSLSLEEMRGGRQTDRRPGECSYRLGPCERPMESRGHAWSDFSFVVSSGYRERVLTSLAPKPKVPRQLAEETDL